MLIIICIASVALFFLLKMNFKAQRNLGKDKMLFRLAALQGKIARYCHAEQAQLNSTDAEFILMLADRCDYVTQNSTAFYGDMSISGLKNALLFQKTEIKAVEAISRKVKNPTVKSFYTEFVFSLTEDASKHTFLLDSESIFFFFKKIAVLNRNWRRDARAISEYKVWLDLRLRRCARVKEDMSIHKAAC